METKTDVMKMEKHECDRAAAEGVYIYGLYLEGCSWDNARVKVVDTDRERETREWWYRDTGLVG